jgi:hypothetical protein
MRRLALLASILCACAPDLGRPHQGDAGTGGVGAACQRDPDCKNELICITQLPGGFCSRLCQVDCPSGLCVRVRLADGSEVLACSPVCGQDAGVCRTGYRCVSVGQHSVCSF